MFVHGVSGSVLNQVFLNMFMVNLQTVRIVIEY